MPCAVSPLVTHPELRGSTSSFSSWSGAIDYAEFRADQVIQGDLNGRMEQVQIRKPPGPH